MGEFSSAEGDGSARRRGDEARVANLGEFIGPNALQSRAGEAEARNKAPESRVAARLRQVSRAATRPVVFPFIVFIAALVIVLALIKG